MKIFEKICLLYGGYVLIYMRNELEKAELYEECVEINNVLDKYGIDKNMNLDDYIALHWKMSDSGETALMNFRYYCQQAMNLYLKSI